MQSHLQNECHLVGEIQDQLSLQWTKKGFPYVDFCLKMMKKDFYKKNTSQLIRCICHGPQAIYIAEKIEQGETVSIKGALDTKCRSFEDGFYYEVTVSVTQCYPFRQMYQHNA